MSNLSLFIARRYFFSKHKKQFINIVSIISMLVVMVGTMALVIALSVFNGLEEVIRGLHSTFNPDLEISPAKGKSFSVTPSFFQKINAIPGVEIVTEVIEDDALLRYREGQMVVRLKGVSDNFLQNTKVSQAMIYGKFKIKERDRNFAVIGRGVQYTLSVSLRNELDPLEFWYPRKSRKVNLSSLNPEKQFNRKRIFPIGVFSLEQSYDTRFVFVPLEFAQNLLEYGNKRSALEIKVKKGASIDAVQQSLKKLLGKAYLVKNAEEQEAGILKAIKIEKLFVYITLSFILAIASFNIFFALMMLVIDKKKDIAILQAMGAHASFIRRIFFQEGVIIAFSGALIGLGLGVAVCLLQQEYGFVSMGTSMTIISAYPVKLVWQDFVYTGLTVVLITVLSSYIPARRATRIDIKENL
ncbi:MAG: FtsX-like permease family protein [Microscillaceae bacterium]|nr:FtsX-like permease family protein [Microscillaceae bacterium]